MFSSQHHPFHITHTMTPTCCYLQAWAHMCVALGVPEAETGVFFPSVHLHRSGLLLVMPGCSLQGCAEPPCLHPECLSLGAQPASAAGPLWGARSWQKPEPGSHSHLKRSSLNTEEKKKWKKRHLGQCIKCSAWVTEGGQHINLYVDGLKNKSENSVAPVTGSQMSYELWQPRVCPARATGQGAGAGGWILEPGPAREQHPMHAPARHRGSRFSSGFAKFVRILNSFDTTAIPLLLGLYLQLQLESFCSSQ